MFCVAPSVFSSDVNCNAFIRYMAVMLEIGMCRNLLLVRCKTIIFIQLDYS